MKLDWAGREPMGKELNLIKILLVGGTAVGRAQVSLLPVPSRQKIKN